MKLFTFSLAASFLLTGCLGLEHTRAEMKKSRRIIEQSRDGQQVATALALCLDPQISEAARVGACKSPLLRLPEDRLADYLGLPLRVTELGAIKRRFGHSELDLPNIMYVGQPTDRNLFLRLSPSSEELFQVLKMAVVQLITELGLKTRQAGLSAKQMDEYRDNARRLCFIAPAILGAVRLSDLNKGLESHRVLFEQEEIGPEQFVLRTLKEVSSLAKLVPEWEREEAVEGLRELGRNVSLTEAELRAAEVMFELRMGVRL